MSRVPLATSETCEGLQQHLRRPTCGMEWFDNGTAMHMARLEPILESDETGLESSSTLPNGHAEPRLKGIDEGTRGNHAVNEWMFSAKNVPHQSYIGEPLLSEYSFDQEDISRTCPLWSDNLSHHLGLWDASGDFEDHWSRFCDMDWDIFQKLPEDIKRHLGREWEADHLDPVRYIYPLCPVHANRQARR